MYSSHLPCTLSPLQLSFILWDVGGQASLRTSWTSYLQGVDAVIFVLDSTDRERMRTAAEELHRVAAHEVSQAGWLSVCIAARPLLLVRVLLLSSPGPPSRTRKHAHEVNLPLAFSLQQVSKSPLLVFANKQDVSGCMTPAEISDALNLTTLKSKDWHIADCSALTGKGVTEGLDWLAARLGAKG